MKITCLQENLKRALTIVARAVSSRSMLPITQNVLLSTEASMLKITATDLNLAMTTWVGANVEVEGSVSVPARLLSDFVNTLPPETISIELRAKPIGIAIECMSFKSNINGTSADDFPPIPTVEDGVTAKIEHGVLREAIDRVAFAAANDAERPVLTGVQTEMSGDTFKMIAADGYRLAVHSGSLAETVAEDMSFLIPARALSEIRRLLGGAENAVELMVTPASNQALCRVGDVEIVTSLLAGNYPKYNDLIPKSHKTRAILNAGDFLRATRTAAIFARDEGGVVRLEIDGGDQKNDTGRLIVSSRSAEVGDNKGRLDVRMEGEDTSIAFNSKYLVDVLSVMSGDVAVELSAAMSPGVIRPAEGDDYVQVIMPIFMNS